MLHMLILTVCAYISCFGAAESSNAADGALQAFTQLFLSSPRAQRLDVQVYLESTLSDPGYIAFACSKEDDPSVTAAVAPLVRLLPAEQPVRHQFAYTSIGKQQLFGCLIMGKHAKEREAVRLIQSIRSKWDLRLGGVDYTAFKDLGCQYRHYPLCEDDVRVGLLAVEQANRRFLIDIRNKSTMVAVFAASAHGVQTFFYNHSNKRAVGCLSSGTTGIPADAEQKHNNTHISGIQTYVVDELLNLYSPAVEKTCKSPLFSIDFNTQKIMDCFGQALPEDEFSDNE